MTGHSLREAKEGGGEGGGLAPAGTWEDMKRKLLKAAEGGGRIEERQQGR
jgi:hypothetical protein